MSQEGLWTFYNSKNPSQEIQVLGLASAQVFARLLRLEEITTWKVKEKNNKSVKECPELFAVPAVPVNQTNVTQMSVPAIPPQLAAVPKEEFSDTRRHLRLAAKLSVALYKNKSAFHCYTKNISPGGIAIEGKIPKEFCVDSCKIVIDSGDNLLRIETTAKVLSSSEKLSRLVFEADLAHKIYDRLVEFIKIHEDLQSKRTIKIG